MMTDHKKMNSPEFNVGIDCEDIERWRKMLPKLEAGAQKKLFSKEEHDYCRSHKDPAPHYAARWCAKEALLKACSPFHKLDLRTIEVANAEDGRPYFILNDADSESLNLTVKLSMSHSKKTAMAIVAVVEL
jgi:holo-[acyl-carrier protein] synthase